MISTKYKCGCTLRFEYAQDGQRVFSPSQPCQVHFQQMHKMTFHEEAIAMAKILEPDEESS